MVISKKTELLGTKSLSKCDGILVYNSDSFSNQKITNALGIHEDESLLLIEELTKDSVDEVSQSLLRHNEFSILPKQDDGTFTFHNGDNGALTGEGFNSVIFYYSGEILGYSVLLSPVGVLKVTGGENDPYDLGRSYKVKTIHISIYGGEEDNIRVDEDVIRLICDIENIATTVGKDFSGNANYEYATKGDLKFSDLNPNYTIHLTDAIHNKRGKNIFLDGMICDIKEQDKVDVRRLNIKKNLQLDIAYSEFNHHQFGFYKGDPCLYIWNDAGQYSIFSLTMTLGDLFGDSNDRPYSYTVNDKVSLSEIFQVPALSENEDIPKIKYFSGKYLVAELEGTKYLFDIDKQDGVKDFNNRGWVKYRNNDNQVNLLTSFLVDQVGLTGKVIKGESGEWSWHNWKDVLSDIPGLSDTYIDSSYAIIGNSKTPTEKIGSWYVLEGEDTVTYSTYDKSITFLTNEERPFVINNRTLLAQESSVTESGQTKITYTLYNEPGYYMTPKCKNMLGIESDLESRGNKYRTGLKTVEFYTSTSLTDLASSPFEIQRSPLKGYRRGVLPETMEDFKIIGGFYGLIFYRIGNIINYL